MLQRRSDPTKWVWCFLALSSGPVWTPADSVTVRTPPNIPGTIEAQAKFFQDFFSVQLSPYKIEFGHVCEDPNTWEQRYEKKDFKNHRDMGKIRWGDKNGGYGEHYWDLNHAGHAGSQGDDYDDGSYHEDPQGDYKKTSEQTNKYKSLKYNPEEPSHYDENERTKRADSQKGERNYELGQISKLIRTKKNAGESKEVLADPKNKISLNDVNHRLVHEQYDTETLQPKDKTDIVIVVDHVLKDNSQDKVKLSKKTNFMPYESVAGVTQHINHVTASSNPVSRYFLEPSTGHIIDKATGQAYSLQPVPFNHKYN